MGQGHSSPTPRLATSASESCPVDHISREAWLKLSQQQQHQRHPSQAQTLPSKLSPDPPRAPHRLPTDTTADVSACPVDHKSREAWLKVTSQQQTPRQPSVGSDTPGTAPPPTTIASVVGPTFFQPKLTNSRLSTERQVSTIPRGFPSAPLSSPDTATITTSSPSPVPENATPYAKPSATIPAHGSSNPSPSPNAQTGNPHDIHTSPSGHWVYPSEAMFYAAMARKNYKPRTEDMGSVIPLHNAVNERTWQEILRWERPYNSSGRDFGTPANGGNGGGAGEDGEESGPRLISFHGDASKLTPRARWNRWMGRKAPFDRHDWVVERGGARRVEYVIDFYEGRMGSGERARGGVGFFLDVRPKLNSFEGVKMRVLKYWGLI